ncbi:cellulase family glycosylhydrolase [Mycobacterium hackensackense]|uniref:cellulase family glycosylhydrolase n=1 Tax=Mycobacterium hackensackense TaxID=228909 RepID=UPI002265E142|nr:cellulase family glycosylhydrolase [Mycobacterium hackensackense]MCV7256096.1 cellulase family glycosylhydrolase [Mycobacterium hackensackense]
MRRNICRTNKFVVGSIAIISASAVIAYTGPGATPTGVVLAAEIDTSSDTLGIADSQLVWETPAQQAQALDAMQALGVNTVRVGVFWGGIELAPGVYNWSALDSLINAAADRNMGVLAAVTTTPPWAATPGSAPYYTPPANPQTFGNFTGVLASRYAGKISAYEVWNEPNAAFFYSPKPDPASYTELLKAAYPKIKAADPNATVIGGVVGSGVTIGDTTMNPVDFVEGMYAAGAEGSFDALSFHPYQYTTKFSEGADLANSPINQLTDIRNLMVANGDASKQIWSSEYGLPTNVVGEQQQADYIQDMVTDWRTLPYAGPAFIYTLRDTNTGSTNDEDNFGVYRTDWTPKAAVAVIKSLTASAAADPGVALTALTSPLDSSRMVTLTDPAATPAQQLAAVAAADPTVAGRLQTLTAQLADASTEAADPAVAKQLSTLNRQLASVESVAPADTVTTGNTSPGEQRRLAAVAEGNPAAAKRPAAVVDRDEVAQTAGRENEAGPAPSATPDSDDSTTGAAAAPKPAPRDTPRASTRDDSRGAPTRSRSDDSSDRHPGRPGAHRDRADAGKGSGDHQRRGAEAGSGGR